MTKAVKISREELFDLYITQDKSGAEIAQILKLTRGAVYLKLRKFKISIKDFSILNSGQNNPAWKGGRRGYYHEHARNLAYQAYDKNCANCKTIWNLHVHHIDGNWKNNDIENLKILCQKCHNKEHKSAERIKKYQFQKRVL